jgi:probable phosphoglycerate mutase
VDIVFVRHAQPAWIADGVGVIDPPLTEQGRRQAEAAAAYLAGEEWNEMLVSPAVRARETAEPIAAATGLRPNVVADLTEIRMPDWSGTPAERVDRIFREARHRPPEEWWEGMPGGESFRDFHERITTTLFRLLGDRGVRLRREPHLWDIEESPGRILVVAHGGTNAVALGFLLGLDPTPWEWERFVSPHASVSRIHAKSLAGGCVMGMTSFGETGHLGADITH